MRLILGHALAVPNSCRCRIAPKVTQCSYFGCRGPNCGPCYIQEGRASLDARAYPRYRSPSGRSSQVALGEYPGIPIAQRNIPIVKHCY